VSFTSPYQQDVKEQVRQATDIVDLVTAYLPLRHQGRMYVGLCPWHDDSRPSLQVNPERQSWKCWVCDLGGDVFSFVMQKEGIDFREALQMLADRAGIVLEASPQARPTPGSPEDKRTLYQVLKWAEDQFHGCLLQAPEADAARRYVHERQLSPDSVKQFKLGFSPDSWQWILDRARGTQFSPAVLEAADLVRKSSTSGRLYDSFKGRLIFPIRDPQGRTIAMGGRVLPGLAAENVGKYINSRETRLFSKSDQLYGLDVARDAVSKAQEVVVVEGYTDVIAAHQVGLTNVVAVLGTALGPRHIRVLRRFADRVILVLDGDEAGQRRTNEILDLFVAEQVDLRILTLPDELDPCDFLLQQGAEPFRTLLAGAVDALEHKVRIATRGIQLTQDTHRANLALEDILATIAKAPPSAVTTPAEKRLREQQMLARLARQFGVAESEIRSRLNDLRRSASGSAVPVKSAAAAAGPSPRVRDFDPREVELLEILVAHPELVAQAVREIETGQLKSGPVRVIYHTFHSLLDAERPPDFGNALTALDDLNLKNILVELDERAHAKAPEAQEDAQARLQGLINHFRQELEARDRQQKLAALEGKRLSEQEELAALQHLIAQERNRRGISAPMDG
jgi:DNA primase